MSEVKSKLPENLPRLLQIATVVRSFMKLIFGESKSNVISSARG
jgi:hypothetical protein